MMPAYGCMDSCPQQRAQMPAYQYHYPMNGALPPQTMTMDPAGFPVPYGGHPSPMPYHGCCSHDCFPNYCPPYSCVPVPFHGYGSYPVYPAVFPYQYDVPLHYPMGGSRFEFDRNAVKNNHCCGCPNHTHSDEGHRKLKIEEAEPDDGGKGGGPLPMVERISPDYLKKKGYPYPIWWIPPVCLKNKEHPGDDPEGQKERQSREDARASGDHGSIGSDMWKQFFPFDISKMESFKQRADNQTQNRHSEESNHRIKDRNDQGKSQFPFPIMFVPSYGMPDGNDRKIEAVEAAPKSVENTPAENKVHPVNLMGTNDRIRDSKKDEATDGKEIKENVSEVMDNAKIKSIPVKQITPGEQTSHGDPKATSEADGKEKARHITVKDVRDNQSKKSSEGTAKKQSVSAKSSSKLPPICLRVDPSPRKRNGNGVGKSPSSPSNKRDSQASPEVITGFQRKGSPVQTDSNCGKDLEPKKTQGMTEATTREKGEQTPETLAQKPDESPVKLLESGSVERPGDKEERRKDGMEDVSSEEIGKGTESRLLMETESGNDNTSTMPIEEKCEHLSRPTRSNLSEKEAATLIQSAYRGFEVRRAEPLKKLKQIAEVRNQVADVEKQIHAIESSSGIQSNDKQYMVIGESIMSLLLKLDTIQGLHPIIRDIRKSVARELTNLHGKLDSLMNPRAEEQKEEISMKLGKCVSGDSCTCRSMNEEEYEEVGNGDCLDVLVEGSSPVECQSHKTVVDPSNCQPDGMVPLADNEIDIESSKSGMATDSDVKVAEPGMEQPFVPNAGQEVKPEMQTNECSLDVNSALGGVGEEKLELAAADNSGTMDVENNILVQLPVDVTTGGHVIPEFKQSDPVEKLNNQADPALLCEPLEKLNHQADPTLLCEPEKTEKGEAELEVRHELAEATRWDGPQADTGSEFVSVEVETEALRGICNETSPDEDQAASESDLLQKQSEGVREEPLFPESSHLLGAVTPGVKHFVATAELEATPSVENGTSNFGIAEAFDDVDDLSTIHLSNEKCTTGSRREIPETELSEGKFVLENGPELAVGMKNKGEETGQGHVQASPLLEDNSQDTPVIAGVTQEEEVGLGDNENHPLAKDVVERGDLKAETSSLELRVAHSELEPRDVDNFDKRPVPGAATKQVGDKEEKSVDSAARGQFPESDKRLIQENEKLRNALEKLIEAGKEQLLEISNLNGRVKDLEKKLRKKKPRTRRNARMPLRTAADKLFVVQ